MKKPPPNAELIVTPWTLAYFHDLDHWFHTLARIEMQPPIINKRGAVEVPAQTRAVILAYTDSSGCVQVERRPGSEAKYLAPTKVGTSVDAFKGYLLERLQTRGGGAAAYEAFGMARPAAPVPVVDPSKRAEHDGLYQRAASLLGITEVDLRAKYSHLNPGLQAMNLRNRLRAKGHNV